VEDVNVIRSIYWRFPLTANCRFPIADADPESALNSIGVDLTQADRNPHAFSLQNQERSDWSNTKHKQLRLEAIIGSVASLLFRIRS